MNESITMKVACWTTFSNDATDKGSPPSDLLLYQRTAGPLREKRISYSKHRYVRMHISTNREQTPFLLN